LTTDATSKKTAVCTVVCTAYLR